jgi:hypothetical protein
MPCDSVIQGPSLSSKQEASSPSDCHLFTALNYNVGGERFEEDREVATAVALRLVTRTNDCYQRGREKPILQQINASVVAGTTWKCSGTAVRLKVDCSYWRVEINNTKHMHFKSIL